MSRGTIMDNLSVLSLDDADSELKDEEPERYTFKVNGYIPHKYRFKCLCCAASCVAIALAIVIVLIVITEKHGSTHASPESSGGKLVLLVNGTKLLALDPKTNNLSTITVAPANSLSAFDVHADGRVYWSEIDASRLIALSSNKSSSVLLEDSRLKPRGLALDRVADNLYATDESAGLVVALNVRLGHLALLIADLNEPRDVALDPEEGLMFVLQASSSIVRACMDGTHLQPLVTNVGITALTLDLRRKRLYWISEFVNIESSDYEGSRRRSFFSDSVSIAALAVLDERLYWLWPSHGHATSLLSCEIGQNDTCLDHTTHEIDDVVGNAESIRSYPRRSSLVVDNPCAIKNGGCQQLCLISGRRRRSCACRVGWQLNADRRSCREARELLLYAYDDAIRASSLDGSRDLIWPTRYEVTALRIKSEIDFDYDPVNDNFYFSDDSRVYAMKLRAASNQTEILSSQNDVIIEDVACDWLAGNLYLAQRSSNGSRDYSIVVVSLRLGETHRKTIMSGRHSSPFGPQRCPYSLALDPRRGYVFYACDLDGPPVIQQLSANGTPVFRYEHPFLPMSYARVMAVDRAGASLYWISFSVDATYVERAEYRRGYSASMIVDGVRRAGNIDAFGQWLFVGNATSVWRANKATGKDLLRIAPRLEDGGARRRIVGMKVVGDAMMQDTGNACGEDNGGCEQFCFNGDGSRATCGCQDGQTVGGDGRCF